MRAPLKTRELLISPMTETRFLSCYVVGQGCMKQCMAGSAACRGEEQLQGSTAGCGKHPLHPGQRQICLLCAVRSQPAESTDTISALLLSPPLQLRHAQPPCHHTPSGGAAPAGSARHSHAAQAAAGRRQVPGTGWVVCPSRRPQCHQLPGILLCATEPLHSHLPGHARRCAAVQPGQRGTHARPSQPVLARPPLAGGLGWVWEGERPRQRRQCGQGAAAAAVCMGAQSPPLPGRMLPCP